MAAAPEPPDAWNTALKYLATRARSTHEVQKVLARRGHAADEIASVMSRLAAARYVDDAEFARAWVTARAERGVAAPARLARELRGKGIPDKEIAAALQTLRDVWDASAAAAEAARRKAKSLAGLPVVTARRRLAAHLERRGFSRDVILATLRRHFLDADDIE